MFFWRWNEIRYAKDLIECLQRNVQYMVAGNIFVIIANIFKFLIVLKVKQIFLPKLWNPDIRRNLTFKIILYIICE